MAHPLSAVAVVKLVVPVLVVQAAGLGAEVGGFLADGSTRYYVGMLFGGFISYVTARKFGQRPRPDVSEQESEQAELERLRAKVAALEHKEETL